MSKNWHISFRTSRYGACQAMRIIDFTKDDYSDLGVSKPKRDWRKIAKAAAWTIGPPVAVYAFFPVIWSLVSLLAYFVGSVVMFSFILSVLLAALVFWIRMINVARGAF